MLEQAEKWLWSNPATQEIWLLTSNNPQFRAYGFYQHLGWLPLEVGWLPLEVPFSQQIKFVKRQQPNSESVIKGH